MELIIYVDLTVPIMLELVRLFFSGSVQNCSKALQWKLLCEEQAQGRTRLCLFSVFNPCLAIYLLLFGSCPLHWLMDPDLFLTADLHFLSLYWVLSCSSHCTLFQPLVHCHSLSPIWRIPTETLPWLCSFLHPLTVCNICSWMRYISFLWKENY